WHQSSLVPYDASRISARYAQQLAPDTLFTVNGEFQSTNYYDENDMANDTTLSANISRRLNDVSTLTARLIYLNDRDRLFGNSQGLEEDLELSVQYRKFDLYANLRNSFLNSDSDRSTFQTIEFGIRRSF
ncbi:MAG TPA: hypothetical protein VMD30_10685, partial [Tepidisphaeraceae bacterium]|nr:hypothetical protein [Tepidisphaeraceae bacterium]